MKAADVRAKSDDELKRVIGASQGAFNLRFQAASGQPENTTRVKMVRAISRIKTILVSVTSASRLILELDNA